MNIEEFRNYCLSLPGVTEDMPFGGDTLVFRVGGKIFALTGADDFEFANLKCDPQRALDLREQYDGIRPGYHMNKRHWNSVYPEKDVSDRLFNELIEHSYRLIFNSLSVKERGAIHSGNAAS
jgi:predicted DNA-binding protein (MmcQ/YjbR family)